MILLIDPHIANMRGSEIDNLSRIGRVGDDFLIARHGGIEAHLARDHPWRATSITTINCAVRKHQ